MQYKDVQNIAKMTIQFIKENIQPGMTLIDIRDLCETKMIELGADSFWYWDVGAFVFAGDETTLSVSGKEYTTSKRVIAENDLNEEFARLLSEKKAAYSEYKKIKKEMRDYQIAKQNVESFYASQQTWNQEEDLKKKRQQQR